MVDRPNSKKSERKPIRKLTSSWAGRTLKSSLTAAKVTAGLAGGSLRQWISGDEAAASIKAATQEAIAEQLAKSLGEMKGLAMKVGQAVSYMDHILPENARAFLTNLQDSTPPMETSLIEKILSEDFGQSPSDLFREWSREPFAAASIGQVHRATTREGREVVVKIQYPGIARTLKSDLANTTILEQLGSVLFRHLDRTFLDDFSARLMEECDYRNECENLKRFRTFYKDTPWVTIPEPIAALSSHRVLTMAYIQGRKFADFNLNASQEAKNRAGEILFTMAFRSIFQHHAFNCDPHPGNYLFLPDGVAFLDFGCVKNFSPEFVSQWKAYIRSVLEGDRPRSDRLLVELGFVPTPEKFDFDYHERMIQALYEPWLSDGKYRFTRDLVRRIWQSMTFGNVNKFQTKLPKDWLFTDRLQWGLFSVLGELEAEFEPRPILLNLIYGPNEARPKPLC